MSTDTSEQAPATGVPQARVPHRKPRVTEGHSLAAWPLLAVLTVQAVLSLRLLRADTAYQEEALLLRAGHLEWAHWLHGAPIPSFSAYFSGAPVIYPPLGALADNAAGLDGARILSLVFMLGATTLLWGATRRLFGRQAAFFAAAMFAMLGPVLHLGAFATYDAMSQFLIALAAWCVVRAGDRGEATGWMVAGGAALALANATAYSSVMFDLVVVVLALLATRPEASWLLAVRRAATVAVAAAALLSTGLLIGGGSYLGGFERTNLARVPGSASPYAVLADSWYWAGLIVVLALCGIVISAASRPAARTCLLAVLTAAAVLGPLEQARRHTAATLNEHVGLGAWFAAIAVGYAVDWFIEAAPAGRSRVVTCVACLIGLSFPIALGASQSWGLASNWANASAFVGIFRPLAEHSTGRFLVEDPSVAEYYLPSGNQWQRWSSTRNIVLPTGTDTGGSTAAAAAVTAAGNAPVYANYIAAGYFSLVALNYTDTTALDRDITADLRRNHHYHIIQVVPYGIEIPPIGLGTYVIWQYQP